MANQRRTRPTTKKTAKTAPRRKRQERYLRGGFTRSGEGDGGRVFTLSFSSEEPYGRSFGMEILSHDEGAVDLSRLNEIGVVLFNHNADRVVGKIVKAWVEDNRGCAEVEFDSDADADTIFQKVAGGTLKGVSVGYMVEEWEEVPEGKTSDNGRFEGPCFVATKWMPYEISVVSVPADPDVGVGRSADEGNMGVSGFYFNEKQLQINQNLLKGGRNL